jgi:hypothetical protein
MLNTELANVSNWLKTNKINCNPKKTNYMILGPRRNLEKNDNMALVMDDKTIEQEQSTKLLGIYIDECMIWDDHINHIIAKVSNGLRMLYKTRNMTDDIDTLKSVYNSLVLPYFDYCSIAWGDCSKTRMDRLQKLQNRAARIITREDNSVRSCDIRNRLNWLDLNERQNIQLQIMMFKVYHKQAPNYLNRLFQPTSEVHSYNLRGSNFDFQPPLPNTNFMKRSFSDRGAVAWNELPNEVQELGSLRNFKATLARK